MRSLIQRSLTTTIILFACAQMALAQATSGSVRGVVSDQNGAAIARAAVTVRHVETNAERRLTANNEGAYLADNLPPGEYEILVEAPGFQKHLRRVEVLTNSNATVDLTLNVGANVQTVEVAGGAAQINTSDYKVDGVITRERIEDLPLNGRSFLSLASLEPGVGVEYSPSGGPGGQNNFFRVSIGGSPQAMTRISVDGAMVNNRITGGTSQNFSQETVQEFQISSFNFDLSVGNTAVGAVNIVSRTGGNAFHGSGFFFYRDHNIAAYPALRRPCDPVARNPRCDNPAAIPRLEDPFFARRNSGVNASGPIKKDRLFFFSNFEYTNQVGARTVTHSNPIFFGYNHTAQQPFRGHLFNTRLDFRLNEKHNGFLRYSHDYNRNLAPGAAVTLESGWISTRNFAYQGTLGLTSVLSPRLVNEFRYSYLFHNYKLNPPSASECTEPLYCIGLGGPRITVQGGGIVVGNNPNVPQQGVPRTYQLNENVYWNAGSHRLRFGGNWEHSYLRGNWSRVFQGQFALYNPATVATQSQALYNELPATLRLTTAGTPTLADTLKLPVSGVLTVGVGDAGQPPAYNFDQAARNNAYRLYIQDSWQLKPKFTFSYGLAWSFEDNLVSHDLDKPEYLRPVLGGANADLRPTRQDYNNFQPAIGFAWSLAKRTVIRGGAGIYTAAPNQNYTKLAERGFIGPAGNGLATVTSTNTPNPLAGQAGQPARLQFTAPSPFSGQTMISLLPALIAQYQAQQGNGKDLSIRGIEVYKQAVGAAGEGIFVSDLTMPYTFHVTAGAQREVRRNLLLSADFVMRRGIHFGGTDTFFGFDVNRYNRPRVTAVNATTGVVTFVPDPIIPQCTTAQSADPKAQCSNGQIVAYWSGINSRYVGLLLKLERRLERGFQFTASYALSRYTSWNGFTDASNLYASYGITAADRPHRLTLSGIYEFPKYKGEWRWLRAAANGWKASLISQYISSPTANPVIAIDVDGDGISTFTLPGLKWNGFGRGQSAADVRRAVEQYNATYPTPDVTAANRKRTPQNQVIPVIVLPDNFSSGDSFKAQDVRLARTIRISEKVRLQVIAEVFNVFNISNLTGYSDTLNAKVQPGATQVLDFGQPSDRVNQVFGTGGPRAWQFAARVSF